MRGDWGDVMRIVLSTAPLDEATDLLWFFFGYAGFFALTEDNGWSPRRAEEWLRDTAAFSLLKG